MPLHILLEVQYPYGIRRLPTGDYENQEGLEFGMKGQTTFKEFLNLLRLLAPILYAFWAMGGIPLTIVFLQKSDFSVPSLFGAIIVFGLWFLSVVLMWLFIGSALFFREMLLGKK